jgi:hypothetical protein
MFKLQASMIQRTALPFVLACAAVSCGTADDRADGPPPFSSFVPGTTLEPGAPAGSGNGQPNGIANGSSGSQGGPGSEQIQPQGLGGTAPPGPASNGQAAPGTEGTVPPPGAPSMLDTVIEAEAFNPATSTAIDFTPGGVNVGGFNVGSVLCFDNVDLTGVQSIDIFYARNAPDVSSSGRFALLWGGADVTQAENLGEKLTGDTGGWDVYQTINVGLNRAVNEVGQLCVRGMRGNGIFVIDKLTLRGVQGQNDGVTNFNLPPPQGPALPAVRVVGNEVQFGGPGTSVAGSSFFWSNGRFGQDLFYTAETVSWLAQDWNAQIVRAAMAVDNGNTALEEVGGYLTLPLDNKRNVQVLVNAAIENGIYVIIDYHAHAAEQNTQAAVEFFSEMASLYGGFNNVIYEIYNEPVNTGWPQIKAYAEQVIPAIRQRDPDNLIVVGTPFYSQQVDVAAADPIDDDNVAYTLHFYAASHGDDLRNRATTAMNNGIALMVTEWGSTNADGFGQPNAGATQQWMSFLAANNISHCNWAVADQGEGSASSLVRGASPTGGWSDADLTASGRLVKGIIQSW